MRVGLPNIRQFAFRMADQPCLKRARATATDDYACAICGEIFRPDPQDVWAIDVNFARHRLMVHRTIGEEVNHASAELRKEILKDSARQKVARLVRRIVGH